MYIRIVLWCFFFQWPVIMPIYFLFKDQNGECEIRFKTFNSLLVRRMNAPWMGHWLQFNRETPDLPFCFPFDENVLLFGKFQSQQKFLPTPLLSKSVNEERESTFIWQFLISNFGPSYTLWRTSYIIDSHQLSSCDGNL